MNRTSRIAFTWMGLVLLLFPACANAQHSAASSGGKMSPSTANRAGAVPGEAQLQAEIKELQRLVAEQARQLESQQAQLREQAEALKALTAAVKESIATRAAAPHAAEPVRAENLEVLEGQIEAVAEAAHELSGRVTQMQTEASAAQRATEGRLRQLGNFHFSGDIRLRYEPFFQGGGFVTRHRERIRARLNITGKLTDEVAGGISFATGTLDDLNSTNQTLTGFFTRKNIGIDRMFIQYKPAWAKPVTLVGGKFAFPWLRTPLTFDSDIHPEGFAQTLNFDLKNEFLKNVTLVGFELPINETGSGYDSFVLGGQVQTRWRLSDSATLRLSAAGVNFNRADPLAVAVATGALRPSLPNTNRVVTSPAGAVTGFASRYLYLDLIAAVDYKLHPRLPVQALFNFVNNTRATTSERSGYWAELTFGRLSEIKDVQFGYTFVRIERDAVLGAFNESDLRASTNVRNHRLNFGYQAYRNVQMNYTLWLGRLANPADNASLVPSLARPACTAAPFAGCKDPQLKRMQFDLIYTF
jgi:uncharacterized coiled-coil protein SlyX